MHSNLANNTQRFVEVSADDLPLHCPTPDQALWNSHPRVYLPLGQKGEALCPYCGTLYKLKGGPVGKHH
jgi:uncharacterized Zn-finger protein